MGKIIKIIFMRLMHLAMLHIRNSEKRGKMQRKMLDYSGPEYENLYQEILIDSTFTYGKFNPIPYPIFKASQNEGAARQK